MVNTNHPLAGRKQDPEVVKRRIDGGAGRPKNTPDILWSKVDKRGPDECWPWLGFTNEQGYGRTWINDRGYYAHRVIYNLVNPGEIELSAPRQRSARGFLMHSCDNPCCCNPAHLSVSTHDENMADKKNKGRANIFGSLDSPRAKFSLEDVLEIRKLSSYLLSSGEIAKVFNVSKPSIKALLIGRTYKDVP